MKNPALAIDNRAFCGYNELEIENEIENPIKFPQPRKDRKESDV